MHLTPCFLHLAFLGIAVCKFLPYTEIMKRFIYLLIQFTWGLGQTAIGFLFFLIHIARPHRIYRNAIETQWKNPYAGLSLGPLYAIVGVISVGWGSVIFPILKGTKKYKDVKYTKCFVEYNASWLGEKITGEKACW